MEKGLPVRGDGKKLYYGKPFYNYNLFYIIYSFLRSGAESVNISVMVVLLVGSKKCLYLTILTSTNVEYGSINPRIVRSGEG